MTASAEEVVTAPLLRRWPLPAPDGDKEAKGRALIVGGGRQTPGAVLLATEAALRVGAGKVQVATTDRVAAAIAAAVPEAFVEGLPTSEDGDLLPSGAARILELAASADAVLLGPGLMNPAAAVRLLEEVVPHLGTNPASRLDSTVVVDALGCAYLTEHRDGVAHLAGRVLLTPNAAELAETLGLDEDEVEDDLRAAAVRLAGETRAVVLSGSATSYTVTPEGRAWRNETGGPGLASAGSGDVKAGAVIGLCARGAEPEQAAVWGSYCHGRAGERLGAQTGRVGYLARDIARELPMVLAEIET